MLQRAAVDVLSYSWCQESRNVADPQGPSNVLAQAQCCMDAALLFSEASPWTESRVALPHSMEPELFNSSNPACFTEVLQPGMGEGERGGTVQAS